MCAYTSNYFSAESIFSKLTSPIAVGVRRNYRDFLGNCSILHIWVVTSVTIYFPFGKSKAAGLLRNQWVSLNEEQK
jgi:hypothetical protein